ncbi:transposase [Dactylosporangium roseum]|uniref:Transposase n=1 Tax=Dactylosporangium roseum TaxID=47989 RepID=A0ABY5ZEM1_9ACTN|nr:transposase [Dactylosporangium roseum]UWZ40596.1 transposase [Dactylosporangium roseum]
MICADELGPVIPRTFPPAAGWSPDGHRVKAPLEYARGGDKLWVYGGLRIRDGTEVTYCAPARNSDGWTQLLARIAEDNPRGPIRVVTDNLSSHTSRKVRQWLARHPRIQQVFIPKRACWLNLAEGWWRPKISSHKVRGVNVTNYNGRTTATVNMRLTLDSGFTDQYAFPLVQEDGAWCVVSRAGGPTVT